MKVEGALHMVGGNGPTSYASNSRIQEKTILHTKPLVEDAIASIYSSLLPETLVVADLGCSSGPNTFLALSLSIVAATKTSTRDIEIKCYLNDLPGNDFNNVFKSLSWYDELLREEIAGEKKVLPPYYVYGVPGSFYGRLFEKRSIHFFHSSFCLMWLSQVPPRIKTESLNKGNIYIAKTSPSIVPKLYLEQFAKDFKMFLALRSKEITKGGRMVLSFLGRKNLDPLDSEHCNTWGLLAEALNSMVKERLVDEGKVNAFQLPFYTPSMEEVKLVIKSEGSFDIVQDHIFESNCDPLDDSDEDNVVDNLVSGKNIANSIRAVMEPMLSLQFGEDNMEDLFSRYAENMAMHLSRKKAKYHVLVISLEAKAVFF